MGFRASRSIESALDLLTSQIQTIWEIKDYIAILLSFDILGAFDLVVPRRLADILRKKRLLEWLVSFVLSFSTNRSTTLVLLGGESELFETGGGVPQGSPLSVVLFILYNSELFEICRKAGLGVSGIGFADDLNALAYSKST